MSEDGTPAPDAGRGDAGGGDPESPEGDPFGPPAEPCECWCLHCHRTFMSDGIWFQRVVNDPDGFKGFWKCPTPNCGGAGFTFDIFPTDPDHPANEGWSYSDDDYDDDDAPDEDGVPDEGEGFDGAGDDDEAASEWDPDEAKYKALDEELGDPADDDDIEGEEWKHGLAPGERPPRGEPSFSSDDGRAEWEAEQRSYDEPDRRPREVDWSDHPSRRRPRRGDGGGGDVTDDEIPF